MKNTRPIPLSICTVYLAALSCVAQADSFRFAVPASQAPGKTPAQPGATPAQVNGALESTAIDMGPAGFDHDSGYGLIQAELAIASLIQDSDVDGIPDHLDNCPNDPNGPLIPDPEGGASQQDDDADNIGNACDFIVSTGFLPAARVGSSYSQSLTALRGVPPYTWAMISGFLPADLTLNPDGIIAGNVIAGGFTANFTVEVTDDNGDTAVRNLKIKAKIPNCYSCHVDSGF